MTRPTGRPKGRPPADGAPGKGWALRLAPELRAAIAAQAAKEGESSATVARKAIRAYLEAVGVLRRREE